MNFKEFLEEVRDYSGSSRTYTRKNDYINRKKREKLKTDTSKDTENNEPDNELDSSSETDNNLKQKNEPEYGTTKK